MACEAATLVGARIVLADRSKAVSNARLKNALMEERRLLHAHQPEDDASLLLRAAAKVASDLAQHLHRSLQALSHTDSQYYAEKLHPIFLLAGRPHYKRLLEGAGCSDPDALVAALTRLMTHGSVPGGTICPHDVRIVQRAIARIEHQKQALRRRLFATGGATAAPAAEPPGAACSTCLLCEGARDDADAFVEEFCRGVSAYACGCAGLRRAPDTAAAGFPPESTVGGLSTLWRRAFALWMEHDATAVHDGTDAFFQWCWRGVAHAHARLRRPHAADCKDACCSTTAARAAADACAARASPYYRTVVHERDTILATRIWDEALMSGADGTVVAVVGANHIPGILGNWAHAGSDAMRRRCVEYLTPPPEDADALGSPAAWQEGAVQAASCAMTGLLCAGLAYAPARVVAHRLGRARRQLSWGWSVAALPGVALGGLSAGAAVCDAWRMSRVAQFVHNLAALPTDFAHTGAAG